MATLGLLEMLKAAIGTPSLGVVDFVALHKLLEAIIGQLGQQQLSVLEPGQSPAPGLAKDQDSKEQPGQEKEEDGALGTGQQLWKPEEQLEGTGSNSEVSSMAKELMPTTTEEEERAVSKKRASLQHLWEEINKFKEVQCGLAEDMRAMQKAMQEAHSGMEQDMREMQEAMQKAHSGMAQDMREMQEAMQKAHSGMAQDIQEMKEAHVGLAEDMHALQEAHSGLAEDIQEIQETLGLPGSSSSQATIPGDAQEPAKPWGSTSTSSYESEMREVLSQVGQLGHLCTGLKEQVEQLKSTKAEHADLENLRRLFPKGGRESITSILADLRCQVSFLQDMARALHGEEEKGEKVKAERKELGKQPEPTQAELEQFAAQYVNKLVMETAQQLQAEVDEPRATVQSGGHEHAGCHFCSPDTRVLLGKLLQRCEKLEEQVESLAQKAGGKVDNYPKWRRQSLQQDEQLKCLQTSIVQLQKGYEKFSSDLANLQQDRQQEQNDVKALSQALGRLEKKQADKEELLVLGIDEKADKAALADKVSRSQLEACVERLTKMMEEVTSRVTGQENGWLQFQKELQRQMDCKKDAMQLSGQDGTDGKRQDEQLSMMGGSQLPTTPTATPETSTSRSQKTDLSPVSLAGHVPCGLICHPDREHILYPLGCTVLIQHLDTKKQSFLHGHADNVSCVVVSRDGMYVASGQVTCIGFKRSCFKAFFSCRVMVWDVSKREAVCGSPASPRSAGNANVVMCSSCRDEVFVTAGNFTIRVWELDTATKTIHPSECYAGQLRGISVCVQMTDDDGDFHLGTTSGDVLKVNTSSKVLTACGPQKKKLSMGVTALLLPKTGGLIVGTGEGTVALCTGSDCQVKKRMRVEGAVTSLTCRGRDDQFFTGTNKGQMYRSAFATFKEELVAVCHTEAVNDIVFPE
ncbi:hypothetical protein Q9966_015573 [Columba livia]|nr:hypothetical protein Q9966_015573 [Columba livia]